MDKKTALSLVFNERVPKGIKEERDFSGDMSAFMDNVKMGYKLKLCIEHFRNSNVDDAQFFAAGLAAALKLDPLDVWHYMESL